MIRYQEEWKWVTRVSLPKINAEANVSRRHREEAVFHKQ